MTSHRAMMRCPMSRRDHGLIPTLRMPGPGLIWAGLIWADLTSPDRSRPNLTSPRRT